MITLDQLQDISEQRCGRWHQSDEGIKEWSPLEWAGAMAGETGEACNAAKKLKRLESGYLSLNHGDRHMTDVEKTKDAIAHEVADSILYGIMLLSRINRRAEDAIRDVFNAKSEEYGFPERV